MKNYSKILIIVLFAFSARGQTYFNKTYLVSNYQDWGDDILKLTDGNYIVAGASFDSASTYGISFLKIDNAGNILAKKRISYAYPHTSGFTSNFTAQISSSSFFCGTTVLKNNKYTPTFSRHSINSLDTLNVSYYSDTTYDMEIEQCRYIGNGQLICIGSKYNNANTSYISRTLVLKIDTIGNIIWKQEIFPSSTQGICIEYNPITKGFICAINKTISINHSCSYLVNLDSLGAVKSFSTINATYIVSIGNVTSAINNEFVFTGMKSDSLVGGGTLDYKLFLIKTGNTGNIIFQRTYSGNCIFNEFTSAKVLSDGSIVACGRYCPKDTNVSVGAFYMKTNNNGDSIWSNRIFFPSMSYNQARFCDIEITSDKGFIFCGSPTLNPVMWVVKTDSMGCDSFANCGLGIADHKQEIKIEIYPNPADDKIKMETNGQNFALKNVSLFNLQGEEIKRVHVKGRINEINVEDLPKGMYLIKMFFQDGQIITRKVIVLR